MGFELLAVGLVAVTVVGKVPAEEGAIQSGIPGEWVLIKGGIFIMGSPQIEPGSLRDETQHRVTLTHDFYFQATEVTALVTDPAGALTPLAPLSPRRGGKRQRKSRSGSPSPRGEGVGG